jgi:hypothetical protein
MSGSHDDILGEELGKLGELGGKIGGLLSGKTGSSGGSHAVQFTAKFLPTETASEKLVLQIGVEKALKLGYSVLLKTGELKTDDGPKAPYPMLKAVVSSGFLNMNPAVVYLEILEGDENGCEVTVTTAAKEGLIKQHTAAKALQRVLTALKTSVGETRSPEQEDR